MNEEKDFTNNNLSKKERKGKVFSHRIRSTGINFISSFLLCFRFCSRQLRKRKSKLRLLEKGLRKNGKGII